MDAPDFLTDKDQVKFDLPIDAVLPHVLKCLTASGRVVLQAPPGAGKTTRTPLAILHAGLCTGKILMLEPRRLAALINLLNEDEIFEASQLYLKLAYDNGQIKTDKIMDEFEKIIENLGK